MGLPQYCEIYLKDLDQIPTVNIGEKCPHTSNEGGKKKLFRNILEHSVLFCFFILLKYS